MIKLHVCVFNLRLRRCRRLRRWHTRLTWDSPSYTRGVIWPTPRTSCTWCSPFPPRTMLWTRSAQLTHPLTHYHHHYHHLQMRSNADSSVWCTYYSILVLVLDNWYVFVCVQIHARALDTIFVLHADHEQNASTSTVRIAGSSQANVYGKCPALMSIS